LCVVWAPGTFMLIPTIWWASDSTKKLGVVRGIGARFASVRFVASRLDPFASREEFLGKHRRGRVPRLRHSRHFPSSAMFGCLAVSCPFTRSSLTRPSRRSHRFCAKPLANHISRPRSASAYDQPTTCLRKRLADA
jgi:hypothetical protein